MFKVSLTDTIAAISTPVGRGGIGIVRLSGKNALKIADRIFIGHKKSRPASFKNYSVHHGWIVKKLSAGDSPLHKKNGLERGIIDEVLLTVMRAPRSYTCEDVVEISCHGGIVSLRAILDLVLARGARLAEPGEFTKRAFLNGRIDLTQAEAVLDVIQSQTDDFLKMSVQQLKGDLTLELESIRESLMEVYTQLEAILNFPEDDIDLKDRRPLSRLLRRSQKRVGALISTGDQGRIMREGIKLVICGRPNVGKSSLLNVLLRAPRAIVSPIAGTTRDTIEESARIGEIPFHLVDTAGILRPRDVIEKEAVRRSQVHIDEADLILLVLDTSRPLAMEDRKLMDRLKDKNVLIVLNKSDLPARIEVRDVEKFFPARAIIRISALQKTAIDRLEKSVTAKVMRGNVSTSNGIIISNARHLSALKECGEFLRQALDTLAQRSPLELASEDVKGAIDRLDQITGRNIEADLLERIFAQFCIGK